MVDKANERASKNHKSKRFKSTNPHMSSHDATPHMTSDDVPPHMTPHDELPPMVPLHRTSNATHPLKKPPSNMSRVPPLFRTSNTKTSSATPHTTTSATRTSNGPHTHAATHTTTSTTRTSNGPHTHAATHTTTSATRKSNGTHNHPANHTTTSATRKSNGAHNHAATHTTSNVPPPHDVPHAASPTRTSNVPLPHDVPHAASATRTSNVTHPSSRVASPSNSQPYDSDGAQTQRLSENVVPSEAQSRGRKQTLFLDLDGFLPSYDAANAIGDMMRSNYTEPWISWKQIPTETRDLWFGELKKKFKFCPPDDAWARNNFETRGAAIMKNNLCKARLTKKRPSWIDSDVWNALDEKWKNPEYKKKCMQAKTNRASDRDGFGKPLHTCGSITTSQHRANLTEENGTPPAPSDLFLHTHQHRKNKTWVDRKSEHVYGKYKHRWEELTQQASLEGTQPPNDIDVWTEVAGIRKGHIYGLGSESSSFVGRRNYRGSSSASTEWVQRHEFEELKLEREEMRIEREEMRKERDELRGMVKQLMKKFNFRPKSYTRDQVHEDDVVDDNDDMVDDNEDVTNDNDDMVDDNEDVTNDNDDMSDDDNVVFDDEDLEQE
ncbi:hypothetical protein P8452_47532 [Trifolium repens]|nr:hypothetical protein P8452_47532 [Trifolium repens]